MFKIKRFFVLLASSSLLIAKVYASPFTLTDIQINGLQRVTSGSVYSILPVNIGDQVQEDDIKSIIENFLMGKD